MEQNTSNEYEISNQQSNDIKGTVSQTPHRRVPYMEIVVKYTVRISLHKMKMECL